jgi:single-stranded DNA-specific DHH superfamily exonuclease
MAHGDADGVSSAAVVKAALAGEYEVVRVYFTHPVDLVKDFEAFAEGDVYIVDVAIDEKTAEEVRRAFQSYGGRVVYIDHHPLSVDLPGVEVVHEVGAPPLSSPTATWGAGCRDCTAELRCTVPSGTTSTIRSGWRRHWRLGTGG